MLALRTTTIAAQLSEVSQLRDAVDALADPDAGLPVRPSPKVIAAWSLAIYEAATNVVRHGHGGGADLPISLEIGIDADEVVMRLRDRGEFNSAWNAPQIPASEQLQAALDNLAEGGYGLPIIRQVVRSVHYERTPAGENLLELRFRY